MAKRKILKNDEASEAAGSNENSEESSSEDVRRIRVNQR